MNDYKMVLEYNALKDAGIIIERSRDTSTDLKISVKGECIKDGIASMPDAILIAKGFYLGVDYMREKTIDTRNLTA